MRRADVMQKQGIYHTFTSIRSKARPTRRKWGKTRRSTHEGYTEIFLILFVYMFTLGLFSPKVQVFKIQY